MESPSTELEKQKAYICGLLTDYHIRLQPHQLYKKIQKAFPGQSRSQARAIVGAMLAEGVLAYTNEFSSTFIVRNQNLSVPVVPTGRHQANITTDDHSLKFLPIQLSDGLAFGDGTHPTTRLCLQGIAAAILARLATDSRQALTVLDVGTGSGVLAIAAALAGADRVVGIDTDPLACREARLNIAANQLSDKVSIYWGDLSLVQEQTFDVIMANLRVPTLKNLLTDISGRMSPGGVGLFSGFRRKEGWTMANLLVWPTWRIIWQAHNRGWMAMAAERGP